MEISDAAVVAQVLAGDKDAFRLLVERHTRSIYSVVYRMSGNQHDAEELLQEIFLRAYTSLHRFELRASFSTSTAFSGPIQRSGTSLVSSTVSP